MDDEKKEVEVRIDLEKSSAKWRRAREDEGSTSEKRGERKSRVGRGRERRKVKEG